MNNPFRQRAGKGGHYQADVINPSMMAGGKGKSKAKGGRGKGSKGKHGYPEGADGEVMACHNCGSDQRLVKDCPQQRWFWTGGIRAWSADQGPPPNVPAEKLYGPMVGALYWFAEAAADQAYPVVFSTGSGNAPLPLMDKPRDEQEAEAPATASTATSSRMPMRLALFPTRTSVDAELS